MKDIKSAAANNAVKYQLKTNLSEVDITTLKESYNRIIRDIVIEGLLEIPTDLRRSVYDEIKRCLLR